MAIVDRALVRINHLLEVRSGLAPDMGFALDEEAAWRRALPAAATLVVVNAKMGKRPPWDGHPHPSPERGANGKPKLVRLETVSRSYEGAFGAVTREETVETPCAALRAGRYPQGAFCPLHYDPDPAAIVRERAEYLVWWAALDHLAAVLQGQLSTLAVLAPSAPARPWAGDRERGKPGRVFEALREEAVYRAETPTQAAARRRLARRRPTGAQVREERRTAIVARFPARRTG